MYTKDNIIGLTMSIGDSSHYLIKEDGLYSCSQEKPSKNPEDYAHHCGHSDLVALAKKANDRLNFSHWNITGYLKEVYEIY